MIKSIIILVLTFLVMAFVFIWAENQIAPHFQRCISHYASQQSAEGSYDKSQIIAFFVSFQTLCSMQFVDRHNGFFAALAGGVVAAFTATLWYSTHRLWKVTHDSIELATKEYISNHRPRIILRDVHLEGITVHYILVNVGDTKAVIVESLIAAEFVEDGSYLRAQISEDHNDIGQIELGAGETKKLTYELSHDISFAIMFPETRRIGINDSAPIFGKRYFVGTVVYRDDNGVKRRSVFRRLWNDRARDFIRLPPDEERNHEYAD